MALTNDSNNNKRNQNAVQQSSDLVNLPICTKKKKREKKTQRQFSIAYSKVLLCVFGEITKYRFHVELERNALIYRAMSFESRRRDDRERAINDARQPKERKKTNSKSLVDYGPIKFSTHKCQN